MLFIFYEMDMSDLALGKAMLITALWHVNGNIKGIV